MARKLRLEFDNRGPMELGKPLVVATLTLDTLKQPSVDLGTVIVSLLLDHLGDAAFEDILDAMFPEGGPTREQHAEELRSLVASMKGVESFEDLKKKLVRKARDYVSPLADS